jgi:hypothetical protein
MKKRLSTVMAIASLAILLPGGAFAASPFNGKWNFAVTSKKSPGCGVATYPYSLSISEGTVTAISGPSNLSTLFASVNAAGNIEGVIASRGARSVFSGRLRSGAGSGVWSSQDWGCAGTWTARKVSS